MNPAATAEAIKELRDRGALRDGKLNAVEAVSYFFSQEAYEGASGEYAATARAALGLLKVPANSGLPDLDKMLHTSFDSLRSSLAAAGVTIQGTENEWKTAFLQFAPDRGFITASNAR